MALLLNIDVPDVEAGVHFYTAAFDLKVGRRFGADFVELLGWPAPVYLLAKKAGTVGAGGDLRRYGRHWTPVHLDFVVTDLDATVSRLTARGGSLDRDIKIREYGRIANMADPFGNGFDLIEFSGSGYEAASRS